MISTPSLRHLGRLWQIVQFFIPLILLVCALSVEATAKQSLGDDRLLDNRKVMLRAIDHSLRYLRTSRAAAAYARLQRRHPEVTRERVRRSLLRFRYLLNVHRSPENFEAAVRREFVFWTPYGEPSGTPPSSPVHFTGYYEPLYEASRSRTATYRYPLYRLPPNFAGWPRPHPTREQLEGRDGLQGSSGPLRGREIVYLRDRLQAFLVQVQGSARLRLPDGRVISVGYAGNTAQPYTSIGRQLVKDGKIREEELTLPAVVSHFRAHPEELEDYLPRNRRFVFFRETRGEPPRGALAPVTAERSIATDKALLPPGALARIEVEFTNPVAVEEWKTRQLTRYVLDQDAGSAIKGYDRVDIFIGSGPRSEARAGVINSCGRLYYLLLKDPSRATRRNR